MKVIIVGGVAGGASAAARLRRLDEKCEIVMYERGEFISFANCGLPYHVGGAIEDRDALLVQTPEGMSARFEIDIKTMHEVTAIDPKKKEVSVRNVSTGSVFTNGYDHLILSPGAAPVRPPIPGIDGPNVFTLRTIPDMDRVIAAMKKGARDAVVIGGGYIGVEMAENFAEKGLSVSLVERMPQILTFLDPDMAAYAHVEMKTHRVRLFLSETVTGFSDAGGGRTVVTLASGRVLPADIVIMAIGVAPEVKLARDAGLKIGVSGGIWTDKTMRTSDPSIYAVGDAVEVTHFVTGAPARIPLAGPANRQARIAVNNICGMKDEYRDTQGTSIIKVFDMACAATGAGSDALRKAGIPFRSVSTHGGSHAGYYPGAYAVHMKLLYAPDTGKILGAQACGYDGVDKRIDVIATAIRHGATVEDLTDYELSYAPPYGSAKDPVNMAGFVATNDTTGFAPVVDIFALENELAKGAFLLDIRNSEEVNAGKIKDAYHIPLNNLRKRLVEVPKGRRVVVYCKVGLRGYIAQRILAAGGYDAVNLTGGYDSYNAYFNQGAYDEVPPADNAADDTQTKLSGAHAQPHGHLKINACGLQCPGPLMKLREAVIKAKDNDVIEIESTDQGFHSDVQAYAASAGLKVLELDRGKTIRAKLLKCPAKAKAMTHNVEAAGNQSTIVVFSDDLDKVMASCIIANGALSMGRKVSLFFTFWGLNVLKKDRGPRVEKGLIGRMLDMMMPRGPKKLALSKMHMLGAGTAMIRGIMKSNDVEPIDRLLAAIKAGGGRLVACSMSMELMGIKKEEFIDGVEAGGVATYLADAAKGGHNLFI